MTRPDLSTSFTKRLPAPERMFLLAALLISGTVNMPQIIKVQISGLGFWTIICAAITWGLWAVKPRLPSQLAPITLPLGAFTAHAALSSLWGFKYGLGVEWIQQLAVMVAFFGLLCLAAREVSLRPWFTDTLLSTLDWASVFAATAYMLTWIVFRDAGDEMADRYPVILARPFAIFVLVAGARQLARWHAGEVSGLLMAIWLIGLVTISQSRMGMLTLAGMFPLSYIIVGGKRNLGIAALMLAAGVFGFVMLLTLSQDMYDRFFAYDASLEVGGVAINASGRTAAWEALMADVRTTGRFLFGSGVGSASIFVSLRFENLPHPHNDYLRFFYDYGVFGLGCFLVFMLTAIVMLLRRVRYARDQRAELGRHAIGLPLTAILMIIGIGVSMMSDNPVNYIYAMAPLGIVIGAAMIGSPVPVAAPKSKQTTDDDELVWVFNQPVAAIPLMSDEMWEQIESRNEQASSAPSIAPAVAVGPESEQPAAGESESPGQ